MCREGSEGPPEELKLVGRAGRSRTPHLEGQEGLEVIIGWPGGVGRRSWRAGRGREALPNGREGLEDPSEWSGVGSPPKRAGSVRSPSWWLGGVRRGQERSGGPPGGSGVVWRHSQSSKRGWEGRKALPKGWEGSGILPGGSGGLGGPPVGPGGVGSSSWRPLRRSKRVGRPGRG